jgi:DNA-binding GntR family transcriptional regulator
LFNVRLALKLTRQVQQVKVKDSVAEIIEEAIFAGEINPGDNINEFKLAQQLGVGTTSVREALFDLERRGFIRRIPNRGSFVSEFSEEETHQIYAVRRELEGLAAELVAGRPAGSKSMDRLRDIIEQMKIAAHENDLRRFYENDLEFHLTLWLLSENRFISQLLESITVPLFAFYVMRTKRNSEELLAGAVAHEAIVDAIETADPALARQVAGESLHFFFEHGQLLRQYGAPGQTK